jgi:hypothetical protein
MASIPCPKDCGCCCGILPFPKETWEKHKAKAQYAVKAVEEFGDEVGITPVDATLDCVFLSKEKQCVIYEDRPEICREYGDEKCPCPYFDSKGVKRTRQDRRRVERQIDSTNRKAFRVMEQVARVNGWDYGKKEGHS